MRQTSETDTFDGISQKATFSRATSQTATTSRAMRDIAPRLLDALSHKEAMKPQLITGAWPHLIGEKLAKMTEAIGFNEGVLLVKVRSSSLYSLLEQHEKLRLLKKLREQFPKVEIRNIQFRVG